jgi:hypothetical protein
MTTFFTSLHSRPLLAPTWAKRRRPFYYYYYWETQLPSACSLFLIFFIPDQFCSCLCSEGGTPLCRSHDNSIRAKFWTIFCVVWHVKKLLQACYGHHPSQLLVWFGFRVINSYNEFTTQSSAFPPIPPTHLKLGYWMKTWFKFQSMFRERSGTY